MHTSPRFDDAPVTDWLFPVVAVMVPFVAIAALLAGTERLPGLRATPTRGPRAFAAIVLLGGLAILAAAPTLGDGSDESMRWSLALIGLSAAAEGGRAFVPRLDRPLRWLSRAGFLAGYALMIGPLLWARFTA